MKKALIAGGAVALGLIWAQASQAAVIFSDNFNATTAQQLNQTVGNGSGVRTFAAAS